MRKFVTTICMTILAASMVIVGISIWKTVARERRVTPESGIIETLAPWRSSVLLIIPVGILIAIIFGSLKRSFRRSKLLEDPYTLKLFEGFAETSFGLALVDENRLPEDIKSSDLRSMTMAIKDHGIEFWSRGTRPFLVLKLNWSEIQSVEAKIPAKILYYYSSLVIHRPRREPLWFHPTSRSKSAFGVKIPGMWDAPDMVIAIEDLRA